MQLQFLWLEAVELICIISIILVTYSWVRVILKSIDNLQYEVTHHNHIHSDKPFCMANYVEQTSIKDITTLTLIQLSLACYMYMDNPCTCTRCVVLLSDHMFDTLRTSQP